MFTRLPVQLPNFQRQKLDVVVPFLGRPRFLLNGRRVSSRWGKSEVVDDQGRPIAVQARRWWPDPYPRLTIDGIQVLFGEPWKWYDWTWMIVSMLLLMTGGISGIVLSIAAGMINGKVLRSRFAPIKRYLIALLVVLIAMALWADLWWTVHQWRMHKG